MQLRTGDDIFSKYGSPSRPISPTALADPSKATAGNEPGEIDNKTAATAFQPEPESRPQQHIHQQQSATLSPAFPPELVDHIVDHLHDDKQSLIQCSRASRVFSHATSYHLFRRVSVHSARRCLQFQELVRSSLHPLPSTSSPPSRPAPHQSTHPRSNHLHSHLNCTSADSETGDAHPCDVSAPGWDISKFVRKIEFRRLDLQSPIEEYVSEAAKLVRMLPRIREVVFGWWVQSTALEQIGRAFALDHPLSSVSSHGLIETQAGHPSTGDPLKLHLELVDFDSIRAFLDFLGSFGGRLRELSLASVSLGGDGGNGKDDIEGRCFPGLESVFLGYDAVVRPKGFGEDGPTMAAMMNMNMLFGTPAFEQQTYGICEILESVAPNVRELHLFRDDVGAVYMSLQPAATVLRLPTFRRLKSVTMYVPGPCWSDLIYEIAAWFARDEKVPGEIADSTRHDGSASPSSLPSTSSVMRENRWEDSKRTRIRFAYPVRKGDVDWRRLESAILGEVLDGQHDCAGYGNQRGGIERESAGGNENDYAGEVLMKISQGIGKRGAGGSCRRRLTAGSLWVEVDNGSTGLGELRGEMGRLDELGLLQLSRK